MQTSKKEVSLSAYLALELKYEKLRETTKDIRKERRDLRRYVKDLKVSRENWKVKATDRQKSLRTLEKRFLRQNEVKKPLRHRYPTWLITLVVVLRIRCNCSYGSIRKVLLLLQSDYMYQRSYKECREDYSRVPCEKTLQNWVSKVGFYYMQGADNEYFKEHSKKNSELCLIIDESTRVGTEKLLLVLACPVEKLSEGALKQEDVRVVCVEGSNTWKAEAISDIVKEQIREKGLNVSYILSDEGNNLVKTAKLLNLPHLPDISHLVATCLKKTFKNREDYKAFTIDIGKIQAKLAMGRFCYLRPPKQRAKARFLNQEKLVNWAVTILEKWDELEEAAKLKLEPLKKYTVLINQLTICLEFAKKVSKELKSNGLNIDIIKKYINEISIYMNDKSTSNVFRDFLTFLVSYFEKYKEFINIEHLKGKHIQTCSDIIERLFGIYKAKVSDNYFVTTSTIGLELPLMCLSKEELTSNIQVALESVTTNKIREWVNKQRFDNQSSMRTKFFKK